MVSIGLKKIVLWTERGIEGLPMQKNKKKERKKKKGAQMKCKTISQSQELSSMFDFFKISSYSCSYWCLYLGLLQWLDGR